jgi:alkylhydroperoxidase family enzyme
MTWLTTAGGTSTLEAALSLRPELRDRYTEYSELLAEASPRALAELGRLRIAGLHECESEIAARDPLAGVSEEKVAALDDWERSPLFSPAERATLVVAEKLAFRVHDIGDDEVAELAGFLDEQQVVALACRLALFDLECRLKIALEVQ